MRKSNYIGNVQAKAKLLTRISQAETSGKLETVISLCKSAPKSLVGNPDILAFLGRALIKSGRPWEALAPLVRAAGKNPKSVQVLNNLSVLHLKLCRPDNALAVARKSLVLSPKNDKTIEIVLECLIALGRPKDAKRLIEKSLTTQGIRLPLLLALARVQFFEGNYDDAAVTLRELIAKGHGTAQVYLSLIQALDLEGTVPESDFIISSALRQDLSPDDSRQFMRAAAMIYDSRGEYDLAFRNYKMIAASQQVTDGDKPLRQKLAHLKKTISSEYFDSRSTYGNDSKRPVFVVGMPRSGTSLVEQILASHSQIDGAGELDYFKLEEIRFGGNDFSSTGIKTSSREYLKLLEAISPNARQVGDKLPNNFERLWLLALAFPRATFIYCRRDPMPNCVSCFTNPLSRGRHGYAMNLESLGRYYRLHSELMEYWKKVLPIKILTIKYEELVNEPEYNIKRIIEHVGVDWEENCLNFHKNRRAVSTPSRKQVSKSISKAPVTNWRRFEEHLAPLTSALYGPTLY